MKTQDTKAEFIRLRAEGQSYDKIAKALNISKSTCTKWERELRSQITHLKQEALSELYSSYMMTKEGRIRRLGDTLNSINDALEDTDLSQIAPEKLLDFKLKYLQALKDEYIGKPAILTGTEPKDVLEAFTGLLDRICTGEVSAEQAGFESKALASLLQASKETKDANHSALWNDLEI